MGRVDGTIALVPVKVAGVPVRVGLFVLTYLDIKVYAFNPMHSVQGRF